MRGVCIQGSEAEERKLNGKQESCLQARDNVYVMLYVPVEYKSNKIHK